MPAIITKASAEVAPGNDDPDYPYGTFTVALSTPTRDRDGEEVKADEWELPLPDHVTFDVDHGMSVASTVGSGKPSIDDAGRLIVHGTYASTPLAQQTRDLVREKHIRTVSVAFIRKPSEEKHGKPTRELLNGAFVAVPANREALVLESKALEFKANADKVQAAHDLMVSMGASCPKGLHVPASTPTNDPPAPSQDAAMTNEEKAAGAAAAAADQAAARTAADQDAAAAAHAARLRSIYAASLRAIHENA